MYDFTPFPAPRLYKKSLKKFNDTQEKLKNGIFRYMERANVIHMYMNHKEKNCYKHM